MCQYHPLELERVVPEHPCGLKVYGLTWPLTDWYLITVYKCNTLNLYLV